MSSIPLTIEETDHTAAIDHLAQRAVDSVSTDYSLRVPRAEEDRHDGFRRWLDSYRATLRERVLEDFRQQCPDLARASREGEVVEEVVRRVWPDVEARLLRYALRGLAAGWVSHRFRTATTVGFPERTGDHWSVPLGIRDHGDRLGRVVLDRDGAVIESLSSTWEQLLEQAGGDPRS
jgi:hypothetical protein